MIDFKEQRLSAEQPHCRLERIKIDLADLPARREIFTDVNARAKNLLVITEGVLPYLSVDDVGSLADDLRKLDRVRAWIVDYNAPQTFRFRRTMNRRMRKAPFKFLPADWFGFFGSHGWRAAEIRYLLEESERLGRRIPLPPLIRAFTLLRGLFLSREKRRALRRFAAYVSLRPEDTKSN